MRLPRLSLPLRGKVFLVSAGLALGVSLCGSIVLYRGASRSLREEVRAHLRTVAATAALQVDPELHERIRNTSDEAGEPYRKLKAALKAVRDANSGIRYVYTMRKTNRSSKYQFVVDAEEDPANLSHVGDEYDTSRYPEMQKAFSGPAADTEPEEDKWGTWLSAYAPIRDSQGRAVAIIGLDMSINRLRQEEAMLRSAVVHQALVAFALAVALSLLITKALLRPLSSLTRAAQRIRNGDLDFQVDIHRSDELGQFVNAFNGMIAGLKDSRERMVEQATRDFLSGLFNHMHFQERLQTEIERAERYDRPLAVLVLDIDRFKLVNDTLGHQIGDSILRQLGALVSRTIRSMDIAARYGGDEFAVILPEADEETALAAAERVRADVEAYPFQAVRLDELPPGDLVPEGTRSVQVTVTIGLAVYPNHHRTRDGLIMAADIALCRAKHISRNSVWSYDPMLMGEEQLDPHELYQMLRDPNVAAIQSLAAAVDAKDAYTHGHSERVTDYALQIGQALGTGQELLDSLKVAGLLHDLGKIGVPDSILNKPGALTREEREAIEQHPSVGGKILRRAPQLDQIIPAVMFHHERWDGGGYPDGLRGDSIPLMARILAIADAFDAMTSDRPYRKAMTVEQAVLELRVNAGKQFDPDLVEVFLQNLASEMRMKEAA